MPTVDLEDFAELIVPDVLRGVQLGLLERLCKFEPTCIS